MVRVVVRRAGMTSRWIMVRNLWPGRPPVNARMAGKHHQFLITRSCHTFAASIYRDDWMRTLLIPYQWIPILKDR